MLAFLLKIESADHWSSIDLWFFARINGKRGHTSSIFIANLVKKFFDQVNRPLYLAHDSILAFSRFLIFYNLTRSHVDEEGLFITGIDAQEVSWIKFNVRLLWLNRIIRISIDLLILVS